MHFCGSSGTFSLQRLMRSSFETLRQRQPHSQRTRTRAHGSQAGHQGTVACGTQSWAGHQRRWCRGRGRARVQQGRPLLRPAAAAAYGPAGRLGAVHGRRGVVAHHANPSAGARGSNEGNWKRCGGGRAGLAHQVCECMPMYAGVCVCRHPLPVAPVRPVLKGVHVAVVAVLLAHGAAVGPCVAWVAQDRTHARTHAARRVVGVWSAGSSKEKWGWSGVCVAVLACLRVYLKGGGPRRWCMPQRTAPPRLPPAWPCKVPGGACLPCCLPCPPLLPPPPPRTPTSVALPHRGSLRRLMLGVKQLRPRGRPPRETASAL